MINPEKNKTKQNKWDKTSMQNGETIIEFENGIILNFY